MPARNVIVIGTSMGGIQSLPALITQFPANLPASIFVVQHFPPEAKMNLPEILSRSGPLSATLARDKEPIERGRIYIAPPDRHLLLERDSMRVLRGPKENRARPAIDPLFRSAAEVYGSRAIAVLLTGMQDDGAAGMVEVQKAGGITIVQDPEDAAFPEMPLNALALLNPDFVLPLEQIGPTINRLLHKPAQTSVSVGASVSEEITAQTNGDEVDEKFGLLVAMSCPECGGPLRRSVGEPEHYRCKVGHAYSGSSLLTAQSEEVESALWVAVRTLEERGKMLASLASDGRVHCREALAVEFERKAEKSLASAQVLRGLLLGGN